MKSVLVVAALFASPFFVSCAHPRSAGAEAHQRVEAGATLVDVRTPEEFAAGHLPGAMNIPVDELPQRLAELGSPRKPVVIYCRSGARSSRAEALLKERGFQDVFNLGPMSAWE
ncbi:rhodanese-like domain-containing protein [Corallococcus interemptor]|uniref:Rhodanese-like domain-containing protein n=1 Tax=Corallococcus interemptor TaxID=2316720 RepID=A0A3A8QSZ4_9BACT|nr:rhodanese-like domain-containing protein [Corallococcus interemptor]RKH50157.1 rhodanese-like domain-containing protein [Corallococcus sp. AB050B]RKH69980.1 rhodanese-like domain-containing protein [Corallococcus interemptor]